MSSTEEQDSKNEDNLFDDFSQIRGDAIGDTLYSERWVLRTLIRLSEFTDDSWNSDLEQLVCDLWDTTAEKDIVLFLLRNDFFDVFCKVLQVTKIERCIEVMVGIVGNMACVPEARAQLVQHECSNVLFNLISTRSTWVLIQVVRLLITCLWDQRAESASVESPYKDSDEEQAAEAVNVETNEELSPWLQIVLPNKEMLYENLLFYLTSSTNEELLCLTLDLVNTLLAIPALSLSPVLGTSADVALGLSESLGQLLRSHRMGDSLTENKRLWKGMESWLSIASVMASYQEGRCYLSNVGDRLTQCFTTLVILLTSREARKAQEPTMAVLLLCVIETLPRINVTSHTISRLVTELVRLADDMDDEEKKAEGNFSPAHLFYRSSQLVKTCLDQAEDGYFLRRVVQQLDAKGILFVEHLVDDDEELRKKIENAIIGVRTNGLVQ